MQVRRPKAGRPGRKAFVSGKMKQNTEKVTMISDEQGRELWLGAVRPGRMHDVTAVRTEGREEQLRLHPNLNAEVDSGYAGLARDFPGQVCAPPKKPATDAGPSERDFSLPVPRSSGHGEARLPMSRLTTGSLRGRSL
ncbi:transposase family protein [Streptomyces sp. NPDC096339]|uniref:transposase family protein n=1 Tax=Streptomyces sp. NPDC096339 TaxID=3366086 RepID=UPI00382B4D06